MERYGVSVEVKNIPVLDPEFTPLLKFNRAFLKNAKKLRLRSLCFSTEGKAQEQAELLLVLASAMIRRTNRLRCLCSTDSNRFQPQRGRRRNGVFLRR